MPQRRAITFDVDWAPDPAIALCAELCRRRAIPATFFVTHDSPILAELAQDPLFELGIHPNFHKGSSHGESPGQVIEACLAFVPGARAMRTHDLFCSSSLLELVALHYPQIRTDSSIFLPGCERCRPFVGYHGYPGRSLVRVPFGFADNVAARTPGWTWDREPALDGDLLVFDFHPALVALNLDRPHAYARLKEALGKRPLNAASTGDFARFEHAGPGARTYLESLLDRLSPADCATISAFADAHRGDAS
jgi:hypothetical protein